MLLGRAASATLLALVMAVTPMFGPYRVLLAVGLAASSTFQNIVLRRIVARTSALPIVVPISDYVFGFLVGLFVPSIFPWVLAILATIVAVNVIAFPTRLSWQLIAISALPYLAICVTEQPTGWRPAYGIWLICSVCGIFMVGGTAQLERSLRDRYSDLLDQLDVVVWEEPRRGEGISYINERVHDVLGVSALDFVTDGLWQSMVHPDDVKRVTAAWGQPDVPGAKEIEYRLVRPDGEVVWVIELTQQVRTADGRSTSQRGVLVDITARRTAEQNLHQLGQFVQEIPHSLQILRLDDLDDTSSLRTIACNRAAAAMVNFTHEQMLAWSIKDNWHRIDHTLYEQFADVVRFGVPMVIDESSRPDSTGSIRSFRIMAVALPDQAVGISTEDITDRSRTAAELRHQARHDALTGLANRTYLHEQLALALTDAAATDATAGLLMMDLNQFKEVNDALGHHHGDRLLVELGRRITEVVPHNATVARLGGDEFAVLLTSTPASEDGRPTPIGTRIDTRAALEVARRIVRSFDEPVMIDGVSLQTGVSIGVAMFPDHGTDAETLTQRADVAMYKAKTTGVGVSLYVPDHDHSSIRRLTLLGELRKGIEAGQFTCHYQPRVDLQTGDVVDVEALVRWHHPDHGLLLPGEFIRLAEVSGMIQPLTECVLATATSDIAGLHRRGHHIGVAVNLSVRNLYDPGLLDSIRHALESTGLNPRSLRVEITESELMDDPALALDVLSHIRDQGIEVSIDDFGTGYSSLAYLRDLPISEVKIDRTFVSAMTDGDPTLARSIVDLAHNLGLRAVAEGVETGPALQQLTRYKCDSAQGFFISRPVPIDELERFLTRDGDFYRGWIRDGQQLAAEWEPWVTHR